jgi:hypothetical protein
MPDKIDVTASTDYGTFLVMALRNKPPDTPSIHTECRGQGRRGCFALREIVVFVTFSGS